MDTREQLIQNLLGKNVHVEIDRPIGYQHGDMIYPINYGYIPNILAGDGEAQDAYILGVSEPLSSFDGQVIGAVRRLDDCEDKLIVAPNGMYFHQAEIAQAVHFQEQYFSSTIDSLLRKSCGVIPYRTTKNGKELLILLQNNSCWSFPKGHMEAGETEQQTALLELAEETGLQANLDPDIRLALEYAVSSLTKKQLFLFTGEVQGNLILREHEIYAYRWVKFHELDNYLLPDTISACKELASMFQ